jgi:hypothetical protein
MKAAHVVAVILIFAAPLLLALSPLRGRLGGKLDEKRAMAALPALPRTLAELEAFPRAFEAWFNDHYELRQQMIQWNNLVRVKATGVSPNSNVVVGSDGWLFLGNHDYTLEDLAGNLPFSPAEIDRWSQVVADRKVWAAEHGITYLLFHAPNKHTIYPEHMPSRFIRPGAVTRLTQLAPRLTADHPETVFDARPLLLEAKSWSQVYDKTDSHWNHAGAFVVYEEIMRRLAARGVHPSGPFPREALDIRREQGAGGDLAVYLGLQSNLLEDRVVLAFDPATAGLPVPKRPRLLLMHDSFGPVLYEVLRCHFPQAIAKNLYTFDPAMIRAAGPDVVVHERTERALAHHEPDPPEVAALAAASRKFRAQPARETPRLVGARGDREFRRDSPGESLLRVELVSTGEGALTIVHPSGTEEQQSLVKGVHVFFVLATHPGTLSFVLDGNAALAAPASTEARPLPHMDG